MTGGYLPGDAAPEVTAIIPPPPEPGSERMQQDIRARDAALNLKGTDRYAEAVRDASRALPDILRGFSCALGAEIGKERMPRLYALVNKTSIDVRRAAHPIKNRYLRPRPFAVYHSSSCLPTDDELLRHEGSYPGGQSGIAWLYGEVLAELNPARAAALRQRAIDYGESRVICDGQWQSDVDSGREVGRLVLARLRKDPKFRADFEAAKSEVASALKSGAPAAGSCRPANSLASR